jgi:hypothetical protein
MGMSIESFVEHKDKTDSFNQRQNKKVIERVIASDRIDLFKKLRLTF